MAKHLMPLLIIGMVILSACGTAPSAAGTGGGSGLSSEMAQLPADATTEEMVRAFEADYTRAAAGAGVSASYSNLEYEESDGMATIYLNGGLMLMIDPPSTYYRVWYAGYPESEEWMLQEAQLVLMAADDTLSAGEAQDLVADLFDRAWENRDNNPSIIQDKTSSGVRYSMSTNERWLVSFQISYS